MKDIDIYQVDFQKGQSKEQLIRLGKIAMHVKIATFIIVAVMDFMFEDFDQCAELLFDEDTQLNPLQNLIYYLLKGYNRWDSIFFLGISSEGYTKEKNHAFFPGIPMTISYIADIINPIIGNKILGRMIVSYLMNLVFYFMIVELVYKVTYKVFKSQRMSYICGLLFMVNPSSIFFSSVYTESAYFFLILSAINHYIDTFYLIRMGRCDSLYQQLVNIYMPSVYFLVSLFTRSTGLFSLTVPALLVLMQMYRVITLSKKSNIMKIADIIKVAIVGIIVLIQCVIIYYLVVAVYPYYLYCMKPAEECPRWCFYTIPDLYGFIQKEYWGVQFLGSYSPARTMDLNWSMQSVYIVLLGMIGWIKRFKFDDKTLIQCPFFITTFVLWVISTFFAHIFSFTRFFTTNIMFYWMLYFMVDHEGEGRRHHIIRYLILFNCAGLIFFSNFIVWI